MFNRFCSRKLRNKAPFASLFESFNTPFKGIVSRDLFFLLKIFDLGPILTVKKGCANIFAKMKKFAQQFLLIHMGPRPNLLSKKLVKNLMTLSL